MLSGVSQHQRDAQYGTYTHALGLTRITLPLHRAFPPCFDSMEDAATSFAASWLSGGCALPALAAKPWGNGSEEGSQAPRDLPTREIFPLFRGMSGTTNCCGHRRKKSQDNVYSRPKTARELLLWKRSRANTVSNILGPLLFQNTARSKLPYNVGLQGGSCASVRHIAPNEQAVSPPDDRCSRKQRAHRPRWRLLHIR